MRMLVSLAVAFGLMALPAMAAEWEVVPEQSQLGFVATQNKEQFTGVFKSFTAQISFDPDALGASKARVEVDTSSIDTSFPDDQDEAARGKDWFHVKTFPKAVFETTGFRKLDERTYAADANLTIRGVTQKVTLPFVLEIKGDTAKMEGAVTINRGDFGVGQGQFADDKWFGLDVRVTVALTARRKS